MGIGAKPLNAVCPPLQGLFARYSVSSWEVTKKGQWDDLSGGGRHGNVTRGSPALVSGKTNSEGSDSELESFTYVSGGEEDGIQFPHGTLPSNFTMCSLSKMTVPGKGTVIDAVGPDKWIHGHLGGVGGVAYYGDGATLTTNFVLATQWLVMCGQNRNQNSVFSVNGRIFRNVSGGFGNKILSINDGYGRSIGLPSSWGVAEIIVWNRFLSATEISSITDHLSRPHERMFQDITIKQSSGVKNLFVISFSFSGQVVWHREALGGNLVPSNHIKPLLSPAIHSSYIYML